MTDAMGQGLKIIGEAPRGYGTEAFVRARALWQMTPDSAVDPDYRAAGREEHGAVAAWCRAPERSAAARRDMPGILYAGPTGSFGNARRICTAAPRSSMIS